MHGSLGFSLGSVKNPEDARGWGRKEQGASVAIGGPSGVSRNGSCHLFLSLIVEVFTE